MVVGLDELESLGKRMLGYRWLFVVVPSQLPSLWRHGGKLKTGGCHFRTTEGVVATVYAVAELSDTIRKKSAMSFSFCKCQKIPLEVT